MSKHTPGPWYVDTQAKRADYIRAVGDELPGTCAVAQMCSRGGWSESNANARLIAAAPDLLEALELCLHAVKLAGWEGDYSAQKARAAIAKATGEQA